jgi:hypothetical protein
MDWLKSEPKIDDVLDDPVVGLLMKADRVDRRALEAILRQAAQRLAARRRQERAPPGGH